jgi:hypothetical protein
MYRKSELEDPQANAPFQMLRGCRVCDLFESDNESDFSVSGDEMEAEEIQSCRIIKPADRLKRLSWEDSKKLIGRCGIMDVTCIQTATEVSNPLLSTAVESGLFSEDALDFLNLTLQWTVFSHFV